MIVGTVRFEEPLVPLVAGCNVVCKQTLSLLVLNFEKEHSLTQVAKTKPMVCKNLCLGGGGGGGGGKLALDASCCLRLFESGVFVRVFKTNCDRCSASSVHFCILYFVF